MKENEVKMLEEWGTKNKTKSHFLFFYYMFTNKLEKAITIFQTIDPEIVYKKPLLESCLQICIKRLPEIERQDLLSKFEFLKSKSFEEIKVESHLLFSEEKNNENFIIDSKKTIKNSSKVRYNIP